MRLNWSIVTRAHAPRQCLNWSIVTRAHAPRQCLIWSIVTRAHAPRQCLSWSMVTRAHAARQVPYERVVANELVNLAWEEEDENWKNETLDGQAPPRARLRCLEEKLISR